LRKTTQNNVIMNRDQGPKLTPAECQKWVNSPFGQENAEFHIVL